MAFGRPEACSRRVPLVGTELGDPASSRLGQSPRGPRLGASRSFGHPQRQRGRSDTVHPHEPGFPRFPTLPKHDKREVDLPVETPREQPSRVAKVSDDRSNGRLRTITDRLCFEVAFIRDPRSTVTFVESIKRLVRTGLSAASSPWLGVTGRSARRSGDGQSLRALGSGPEQQVPDGSAVPLAPRLRPFPPVRPIACGSRAEAVFPDISGTPDGAGRAGRRRIDIVLADTPGESDASRPTVVLSDNPRLAVPAFDHWIHNPVGWRRNVAYRVASLGPLNLLPEHAEALYAC